MKLDRHRLTDVYQSAKDNGTISYNCWGASMYLTMGINELKWVDEATMRAYVDSDKFTSSGSEDKREPGDILVIRADDKVGSELIHTATYLGLNEWLHKQGANVATIVPIEEVRKTYPTGIVQFRRPRTLTIDL